MSSTTSPRTRERNGRTVNRRFVEVEMPGADSGCLVIELRGGGRILLSRPAHVILLVQLLKSIGQDREGGRP